MHVLTLRILTTCLEATIRVLSEEEFTLVELHLKDGERQSFVIARTICRLFHLINLLLLLLMMPIESMLALHNLFTALLERDIIAGSCNLSLLLCKVI